MANPFETVILKLKDIGAFEFLFPFMITSAVFYGLLRKSHIFGEPEKNVAVNAVIAIIAAFMVWAYPILAGVSIQTQLSTFFFNGTIAILTVVIGLLIMSMFIGPNLGEKISEKFAGKHYVAILIFGLLVGGGILLSSGLVNVFFPAAGGIAGIPEDVILTIAILVVLVLTVVFITGIGMGGGKST